MKTKISPLSGILSPLRGERDCNKAFTLVELIVVITILAVLSAIGFVAFSGYLAGTRDTNRISQLKSISDGLELYGTKHDLPIPEDKIDIKVGTGTNEKTIAYQGYAGKNILKTIEYSSEGVDPKDGTYFSYYLTKDKKYYQLMAFLEESDNLQNTKVAFSPFFKGRTLKGGGINKTYALDYTARYPTVYGKKLGILTDENNTPVQEVEEIKTNGYLNISTATGTYTARFTDNGKIEGTGAVLVQINPKTSCKRLYEVEGKRKNGIYTIDPEGNGVGFKVYCDMTTDGGGWTLVLGAGNNNTISYGVTGELDSEKLLTFGTKAKLSDENINKIYTSQFRVTTTNKNLSDKKLFARLIDGKKWIYDKDFSHTEHIKTSLKYNADSSKYTHSQGLYYYSSDYFTFNHWGQMDVWFKYGNGTRFYENPCCVTKPNIYLWVK